MNICMECYEEYASGSITTYKNGRVICPKVECAGDVVEIDEFIAPAVIGLNKKGYITKYSCAGHSKFRNIHFYVAICGHVTLNDVPNGFSVEHTSLLTDYDTPENVTVIRFEGDDNIDEYKYKNMSLSERMIAILEINIKFLNWVEGA